MNTQVLTQYNIKFRIVKYPNFQGNFAVFNTEGDDVLSSNLEILFEQGKKDSHLSAILQTIQKAQDKLPYDPTEDGGHYAIAVYIALPDTTLERTGHPNHAAQISTDDLKQIILSWNQFIEENNLEDRVW